MIEVNIEGREYLSLSFDEERALARSVMDCISLRWVSGDFQRLLDTIFYIKCTRGSLILTDELFEFLDFLSRYGLADDMGFDLDARSKDILRELNTAKFKNREEQLIEARRTIIRIWREVWEKHDGIKAIADIYKKFPGDDKREDMLKAEQDYLNDQDKLEEMFWSEVDKVQKQYGCTRKEAMAWVDYIPRGDYSGVMRMDVDKEDGDDYYDPTDHM